MYATATSSSASMFNARNMSSVYRQIDVETGVSGASAHHLITMLLDGALEGLAQARGALSTGQIQAKCNAINKCIRIVDEGLKAGLNLRDGGELAEQLDALYGYITLRLTLANVRNDVTLLEECTRLIQPIREAWVAITPPKAEVVRAAMEIRA